MSAFPGVRYQCIIGFVLLAALFHGCTIPITVNLYNNTSNSIQIAQNKNGNLEATYFVLQGEEIGLQGWMYSEFVVASNKARWVFKPGYSFIPSNDFIETIGVGLWVKRIVRAQIQANGQIFLLKKGESPPVKSFPAQPAGYPLSPM